MNRTNQREIWADSIKGIACILVVLGHFFQSMVKANILPDTNLYQWFIKTIYYFHVPLFFICSGYLFQKNSIVVDFQSWGKNALKKLLVLGIPYLFFSSVTWALKTLFSSSVNNKVGPLEETLFLNPTSPYWYLYELLFLFLITPTFQNKKMAWGGLIIGTIFKVIEIEMGENSVRAILYILSNEIWFVLGMSLCFFDYCKYLTNKGLIGAFIIGTIFLFLSIYMINNDQEAIHFLLGLMACFSIIAIVQTYYQKKHIKILWLFFKVHDADLSNAYVICCSTKNCFVKTWSI